MLQLTRLGGPVFALNPDLIERAEATPDTVVTLVNGSKYVIRESLEELTALIRAYRADIIATAQVLAENTHTGNTHTGNTHGEPAAPHGPRPPHDSMGTVVAFRPGEK